MSTDILSFRGIEGQERTLSLLQRALAASRLGHAYIFEGMEGTGREMTARALFQAIFCASGTGCGSCPPCRRLLAGSHPDLHIVEPDGAFIKIDQIRELQRELSLKPFEAPRKGAVIRQADRLHLAAANALLKTLEEPPGSALLILVTARPGAILPTIRSRCQALSFAPLPSELIFRLLTERGTDPDAAAAAAAMSAGSMLQALEIAGSDKGFDSRELAARVSELSLADVPTLFALSEEFSSDRDCALSMLEKLLAASRDTLLHEQSIGSVEGSGLETASDDALFRPSPAKSLRRVEQIMEAVRALRRNANVRLTLDTLFIRLADGC
jgi:DNA polymerase-3 subunit delta'